MFGGGGAIRTKTQKTGSRWLGKLLLEKAGESGDTRRSKKSLPIATDPVQK